MKAIFAALVAIGLCMSVSAANAQSCTQLANNCIKNGGTKERCFAAEAMAHCKKNCEMIGAYSGRAFKATSGCNKKKG